MKPQELHNYTGIWWTQGGGPKVQTVCLWDVVLEDFKNPSSCLLNVSNDLPASHQPITYYLIYSPVAEGGFTSHCLKKNPTNVEFYSVLEPDLAPEHSFPHRSSIRDPSHIANNLLIKERASVMAQ